LFVVDVVGVGGLVACSSEDLFRVSTPMFPLAFPQGSVSVFWRPGAPT